jgi:hypothetical protein
MNDRYIAFVNELADSGRGPETELLRAAAGLVAEIVEYERDTNIDEACDVLFWLTRLSWLTDSYKCEAVSCKEDAMINHALTVLDLAEKQCRSNKIRSSEKKGTDRVKIRAFVNQITIQLAENYDLDNLSMLNTLKLSKRHK